LRGCWRKAPAWPLPATLAHGVFVAGRNLAAMRFVSVTLFAVGDGHGLLNRLTSVDLSLDVVLKGFLGFGFDQRHD